MKQYLHATTLLVEDYDEAITFFTDSLNFTLSQDTDLGSGKRWVMVHPKGAAQNGAGILLAKPQDPDQIACIGKQGAGRVMFILYTDDFKRDHTHMMARGVRFLEHPRKEAYGTVAVFEDLYANRWDLLEPAQKE